MTLYLTFALALLCNSTVTSSRVLLPLYALQLGASPSDVGLLVATFFAFPLVLSWPVGMFSDRFGPRWLLLVGVVCGAGGMMVPYFLRELSALFVAGVAMGISFSFCNVLLQNLVGVLSAPQERSKNFSNFSLIGSTTSFVGPMIAGFGIDYSGHAVACLYVASLTSIATLMLLLWGKLLPGGRRQSVAAGSLRDTLKDPAIVRILITSTIVLVSLDLYTLYLPVYGHGIGISASAIGMILATCAIASFFVRVILPTLVRRLGEEKMLVYSFCLVATGFLLVPFFSNVVALAAISFIFGLGMGCGQPITTMLLFSLSAKGRSGETLGLRQTVNNVVRVIVPTVSGFVASAFGLWPVFMISALMVGCGAVMTSRGPGRARDHQH